MTIISAGVTRRAAGIHLSLGALVDCAGDDSYIAYFGVSQGCGHDWAYGILEDKAGDDYYQAKWLSQGAGNDCGMGVLFDHKGDDRYVGERDVQGHGSFNQARNAGSVGIFMDSTARMNISLRRARPTARFSRRDTRIGLFSTCLRRRRRTDSADIAKKSRTGIRCGFRFEQ